MSTTKEMSLGTREYFGHGTSPLQLKRMAACFVFFTAIDRIAAFGIRRVQPEKWKSWDEATKVKVPSYFASMAHSLGVVCASTYVLLHPTGSLMQDKVHGMSDEANLVFAFTTAFFAFDSLVVLRQPNLQLAFLVHHVLGIVGFLSVQFPYLQYYSLLVLYFETSTIFLLARNSALAFGYESNSPVLRTIEGLFGISFLCSRILFGLPFSYFAVKDSIEAYFDNNVPSNLAFFTLTSTNILMNFLNVYWFYTIVKKAFRKKRNTDTATKNKSQ